MEGARLNVKLYMPEGSFSLDFFSDLDLDNPDSITKYLQRFFGSVQQAQQQLSSVARFRTVPPFYFTLCPRCKIYIRLLPLL
jgi:hypothetical protein